MALGLRNKKRAAAEAGDSTTAEVQGGGVAVATPSKKKRKPQELLSSVVKESTVSAAVALLKENTAFALPSGKSWVVLALPVAGIGGLSMKQKGDEAKGSLIELISNDEIATVATLDMLESEILGIIPSAKTLARMDEFSMLKNADYVWVVMTQTPEGALTADPVDGATYGAALDIAESHTTLAQALPEVWKWGGGSTDEDDTLIVPDSPAGILDIEGGPEDPFGAAPLVIGDDNPFGTGPLQEDAEVDYASLDAADNAAHEEPDYAGLDEEADQNAGGNLFASDDPFDAELLNGPAATEEPVAPADDRVVDMEAVRASIARRFLSSDLDLTVDLETFDANFITGDSAVEFPVEEDTTDWLGRQVNQLARQANTQLAQTHARHQAELRELYVSLMSRHVEQVIADVSIDKEGTYYHRLFDAARTDKEERQRNAPAEVATLRRELNERYEAEAEARGQQAAEQAKLRYREQNRPRHERELADIGLASERAAEDTFEHAQQTILELRRKDANTRLDMGQTKILDVVMELQQQQRAAESALVDEWSAQMTAVLDTFRKDDIARTKALEDQLSRTDEIEQMRREHTDKVRDLRRDHARGLDELNRQLEELRAEASRELSTHEANWQRELNLERERATSANSNVQQALNQFSQMSELKDKTHETQLASLRAANESYAHEVERSAHVQKRANLVLLVLIVVVALAALAVGFILGHAADGSPARPAASAAITGIGQAFGTLPPQI